MVAIRSVGKYWETHFTAERDINHNINVVL